MGQELRNLDERQEQRALDAIDGTPSELMAVASLLTTFHRKASQWGLT